MLSLLEAAISSYKKAINHPESTIIIAFRSNWLHSDAFEYVHTLTAPVRLKCLANLMVLFKNPIFEISVSGIDAITMAAHNLC